MSVQCTFENTLRNEFQWSNLYLSKWHSCTYRVGTWRDMYQLRVRCPWYPLLLWVTDSDYDHWHLIIMTQLFRAVERELLLSSLVKLVSTSDGDLVSFVIAMVTQDMTRDPVQSLHPGFSFPPDSAVPLLFSSLAKSYGGSFLQRLVGPLLKKKNLRDDLDEAKSVPRGERGEVHLTKTVSRMVEDLLHRVGVLAESIPLELWCCMVLAQRLHNQRVLEFLEVPGFDTRLVTVAGTKEAVNPRSREIIFNVVVRDLLIGKWLAPALCNLYEWGVSVQRSFSVIVAAGLEALMEKMGQLLVRSLSPEKYHTVGIGTPIHTSLVDALDSVMSAPPLHMRHAVTEPSDEDIASAARVVSSALYATRSRMVGRLLEVDLPQAKDIAEKVKSIAIEMQEPESGTTCGATHSELISNMRRADIIKTNAVEAAMRRVNRGHYTRAGSSPSADAPQSIGYEQTISAPHMHAMCLEELSGFLKPGASALDCGSGSGYLVAAFSHMVGDAGQVCGVECVEQLVPFSLENLKKDGWGDRLASGAIQVQAGDASKGLDGRKFDAIHVGAGAPRIPKPLVDALKSPGRMLIPVGDYPQSLVRVDKSETGHVTTEELASVVYVPFHMEGTEGYPLDP